MMAPKFNLIDEPWIKVMMRDGSGKEFSLRELFRYAHEVVALAGETPLQDTAILRFLVALNVSVMYRYDMMGADSAIVGQTQALKRFKEIWDSGCFPDAMIERYFEKWYDRFYLLGGERPFYQVPTAYRKEILERNNDISGIMVEPYRDSDKLSLIGVAAMNGEVLESGNSPSTFAGRWGTGKDIMSLNEASRWLLYYMTYADCASKIPGKWNAGMTFASGGANIHPIGTNLFQSIMLCSCLVNKNENIYKNLSPAWENDRYTEINGAPYGEGFPDNLPELYTQQSRKVVLVEKEGFITGAFVAAGDRYGNINAYVEPMFAFHVDKSDKTGMTNKPNHMEIGANGWKEFKNIFGTESPNPIRWISLLFDAEILPDEMNIPFRITDLRYGSMSCGVDYTYNSAITVNRKFFEDGDEMEMAKEEIEHINEFTNILKTLGENVELARGMNRNSQVNPSETLRKNYENHIGNSFNRYLTTKITCDELRRDEVKFAYDIANTYLNNVDFLVLAGHKENTNGKTVNEENTIGKAENIFGAQMYKMKEKLGLIERSDRSGK